MMQSCPNIIDRYTAALDRVVEQLQADYYVLAAVLYGSLARGDTWERSDIDLMIVLRDGQERESRDLWIVEDDINIFAWAVTHNRFKRALEGELQGSMLHSIRSQFKILFTKDDSIADWVIDLDPDGGLAGGCVVAQGTPEQVAQVEESYTGQYLKTVIAR